MDHIRATVLLSTCTNVMVCCLVACTMRSSYLTYRPNFSCESVRFIFQIILHATFNWCKSTGKCPWQLAKIRPDMPLSCLLKWWSFSVARKMVQVGDRIEAKLFILNYCKWHSTGSNCDGRLIVLERTQKKLSTLASKIHFTPSIQIQIIIKTIHFFHGWLERSSYWIFDWIGQRYGIFIESSPRQRQLALHHSSWSVSASWFV